MSKDALPPLPGWPKPGTVWRHRKGGKYVVTGQARFEATLEPLVLYAVDGPEGVGELWARPNAEFSDGRFSFAGDVLLPSTKEMVVLLKAMVAEYRAKEANSALSRDVPRMRDWSRLVKQLQAVIELGEPARGLD